MLRIWIWMGFFVVDMWYKNKWLHVWHKNGFIIDQLEDNATENNWPEPNKGPSSVIVIRFAHWILWRRRWTHAIKMKMWCIFYGTIFFPFVFVCVPIWARLTNVASNAQSNCSYYLGLCLGATNELDGWMTSNGMDRIWWITLLNIKYEKEMGERERGTNNGWELELLMPDNGESNDMMNLIRSSKILIEWLNSANTFQVTCILCQWIEEEPLNCSIEWFLAYEKKWTRCGWTGIIIDLNDQAQMANAALKIV